MYFLTLHLDATILDNTLVGASPIPIRDCSQTYLPELLPTASKLLNIR